MAVLGRLLISSAERLDLPDVLAIDSYAAGDFKYLLKGLVNDTKPYILKGFDVIDPQNALGTQSASIRIADSCVFYPGSDAGPFFYGLPEGNENAQPLVPELRKNAVNYVYLTFTTFNTSTDSRAFWDPDKDGGAGGEFTQDVNTESVLTCQVNVSVGAFPENTIPIAKITVGAVVITAIEDARDMMFRLGTGGINPDPYASYDWRALPNASYERAEPPTTMTAGGGNPFEGADKNILSLKEWMDAVMSKLRELGGTTYWYDDSSSFSIVGTFLDALATTFKSKGMWVHSGTTPGLVTWTEDINIKLASDPRTYILRAGDVTLADEQVAYLNLIRNQPINATDSPVAWTNSQPYVNTVGGSIGLFANLQKGDWIKRASDPNQNFSRVEEFYDSVNAAGSATTAANAKSIRLSAPYVGITVNDRGRYDRGVYTSADVVVSDRNQAAIAAAGGNFSWLVLRSDTIENIGSVVTTDLSVSVATGDGSKALVTTTAAHGLLDKQRITLAGTTDYDGTYQVEVATATTFYITTAVTSAGPQVGTGHYAIVTTAARTNGYGLQLESANHGFATDEIVQIAGTTNYNGSYDITVIDPTHFQIATPAPAATETVGTATLARVLVRSELGAINLIQGQSGSIGDVLAENIKLFLGMTSDNETHPDYFVPAGYNTLAGTENYNGAFDDNVTVRLSKLTAMMADKTQDKTLKFLPSEGITAISNTTNGAAQELRFVPDGSSLTIATPSSNGQTFIALPGSVTPISLLANQAAYVQIDRNAPSTVTWTVANIVDVPLEENTFVIAIRLSTPDIYIWDSSIIMVGSQPPPSYIATVIEQDRMTKLVAGGTWAWTGTVLSWSADAAMQVPGLANTVNTIVANNVTLASGEVAYVNINRAGPGGNLTVQIALNTAVALSTDRFIIAREDGGDVIVGNHSMRLIAGESKKLYAGASDQNITFIGATGEADDAPDYSSNNYVTDGDSLVTAISELDAASGAIVASIFWKAPVANFATLPATGNIDGDVRLTLDTNVAFRWDATAGAWIETSFWNSPVANAAALPLTNNHNGDVRVTLDTRLPYSWDSGTSTWKPVNGIGGGTKIIGGGTFSLASVSGFVTGTGFDALVTSAALQTDGKILVGGSFLNYNGVSANRLARLNSDGTLDTAFQANIAAGPDQAVQSFLVQPDGKILVGGQFTNYQGTPHPNLIRLNSDGTLDTAFMTNIGTGPNGPVVTMIRQSTGDIIIGGSFTTINGVTRQKIARMSSAGVDDATFYANVVGYPSGFAYINILGLQADDKFVIGGGNLTYNRRNADGTNDTAYNTNVGSGPNSDVHGTLLQADGKFVVTGEFTTVNGNARNRIVRYNTDGTEDTAFYTNCGTAANGSLYKQGAIDSLGRIYIIGQFSTWNGAARPGGTVRLLSSGVEDTAWYTNQGTSFSGNSNQAVLIQPDGKSVSVGTFTTFNGNARGHIVRLLATGIEDSTASGSVLSFTAPMYIEQKGLSYTDNTILIAQSPITFASNFQAAWVLPNLTTGGPNLTVSVSALSAVPLNAIVIARRDDPGVVVDHTRIIAGKTITLDSGVSNELLSAMPASSEADNTGIARLLINSAQPTRVNVTSASKVVPDGTTYDLQVNNLLMKFTGAQIDFATGTVYAADGASALGINFTPATIAANQWMWYSVTLVANATQVDNTISAQLIVLPAAATGASITAAPRAPFATGIPLGQVAVQKNGANTALNAIVQTSIVQLSASGGGSGTGDANELYERLKDYLQDSTFEFATADIIATDKETLTDKPNTTATYSIVNNTYQFTTASQVFRTVQLLDVDYLAQLRSLSSIDLVAYWKFGSVDTAAIYEASLDGGTTWSTIAMLEVGNTDIFRGTVAFPTNTLTSTQDLRIRITSSAGDKEFRGLGVFYGQTGAIVTGIDPYERFVFSGTTNVNTFTLTKFKPDLNFLQVFDENTGKVYVAPAFTVAGMTVTFPAGTFYAPGETIGLKFAQQLGGSYDSSNVNGNLLGENRLGSRDATADRSVPGEGILLRSTNGDLCEVWLEWNGTTHDLRINKVN